MDLHVDLHRVQRRERPRTDLTRKRLRVSVFVAGKLDAGLESFRAERALVVLGGSVRVQMMIVNALTFKPEMKCGEVPDGLLLLSLCLPFIASVKAADVRPFL